MYRRHKLPREEVEQDVWRCVMLPDAVSELKVLRERQRERQCD